MNDKNISLINQFFKQERLSELHHVPYESIDDIERYVLKGKRLRSQSFKKSFLKLISFISLIFKLIKQNRQLKKNISELENLSDHLLKDIGIKRGDIHQLVYSSLVDENSLNKDSKPRVLHLREKQKKEGENTIINHDLQQCG